MGEGGGTDRVWRWGRGEGLIESGDGGGGGTDRVWRWGRGEGLIESGDGGGRRD